jgi:hypothetical protein
MRRLTDLWTSGAGGRVEAIVKEEGDAGQAEMNVFEKNWAGRDEGRADSCHCIQ